MDWKKLLPLLLGIILSIVFAVFAVKAMKPGDHRPTGVFNNEYNSSGILEDIGL